MVEISRRAILRSGRLLAVASAVSVECGRGRAATGCAAKPIKKEIRMTMKHDLAARSSQIHWPEGFDPESADLFSHNELVIQASCDTIWSQIIDAEKWPLWYPNSKDVALLGGAKVLGDDTIWRWNTFGLPIESKIHEYVPHTRLGWYGYPPGTRPSFYHAWLLMPQGDSCLVLTDEVGMGKDAVHLRETDENLMHRGHDLWLATLKWVSEGK